APSPPAPYTLSLHDALPIFANRTGWVNGDFDYNGIINSNDYFAIDLNFLTVNQSSTPNPSSSPTPNSITQTTALAAAQDQPALRSEEHTSELQSLRHLVCRL